jgi:N utilization substance protein B
MTRREAREQIMKMLYEASFQPDKDQAIILQENIANVKGKVKDFIQDEFLGVLKHQQEIQGMIEESAKNWSISRIARIDYVLLQLAIYELKFGEEIPPRVVINEAIEIAKIYSTEKSPKFIHGVLANAVKLLEA